MRLSWDMATIPPVKSPWSTLAASPPLPSETTTSCSNRWKLNAAEIVNARSIVLTKAPSVRPLSYCRRQSIVCASGRGRRRRRRRRHLKGSSSMFVEDETANLSSRSRSPIISLGLTASFSRENLIRTFGRCIRFSI